MGSTITTIEGEDLSNCATCGLLCPAARAWGRCPEAGFEVLTERLPEFEKAFGLLVKRAGKLGCSAPSWEALAEYTRVAWLRTPDGTIRQPRRSVGGDRITLVRVHGKAPSFNGWSLLATLSPLALPEGSVNLVKSVPGSGELPERYRTSGTACDHCRANRDRKETFVVRHEDGRTQQVGRQCIRDFLGGSSPESVAAMFTFWKTVGEIGDEGEGGGWGRRTDSDPLIPYLGLVIREVRANGWLGRKAAREQDRGIASADAAWDRMRPSPLSGRRAELADEVELELATSAVVWACSVEGRSDYEHNLKAIALSGSVDPATAGLAASTWIAFERACQREVERKQKLASVANSEWQGQIDASTGVLFLTVTKVLDLESEYGATHLHMLQDSVGNAFKWFASTERLDVGTLYRIEGKIKKHDEFQGIKSTVLTRCSASDPTRAWVKLSPAMQKFFATTSLQDVAALASRIDGEMLLADGPELLQLRRVFETAKGASARKAVERIDAAYETVIGNAHARSFSKSQPTLPFLESVSS